MASGHKLKALIVDSALFYFIITPNLWINCDYYVTRIVSAILRFRHLNKMKINIRINYYF